MGNIKQSGIGPGVQMFFHNAQRIMYRHGVAGKGNHLSPLLKVIRMKNGTLVCAGFRH